MKNLRFLVITISLLSVQSLFADEPQEIKEEKQKEQVEQKLVTKNTEGVDLVKLSESFGHLIGKNIETLGFQLDLDSVIKGLQESVTGQQPPLNETECVQAIATIQENIFKNQAKENLKKADEFLAQNSKENGVVILEEGKLQYKIENEGKGAVVASESSPLIRYTGKFLDGTVFGSSKEEESISLDETIVGFSKGLIGMKEGEKRTLFIHPELGYGTNGYLPPNSLLMFEVEIVKAHAPISDEKEIITTTTTGKASATSEIAIPDEKTEEVIR